MVEGLEKIATVRHKESSIDGIHFHLIVTRGEEGTHVYMEAKETRSGYPKDSYHSYGVLHEQPYDPDL